MKVKLGDEIVHDGVIYILVDAKPIRLMTGLTSDRVGVCALCQANRVFCKIPYANNKAYDMCKQIASAIFVKKLEV